MPCGGSVLFLWGVLSQLGLVLDRQLVPNSLERTTVRFPNKILKQIQNTKQNIDTNTKTLLERATMWRDVFQEFSRNDHRWDTEICGIIWSHQCMAHCKAHNSQIPPLFRPLSALESCQEKTPSRQKAENTPFPKCALNSLIAQSQDLSVFCRYSELTRHRISPTLPKNWL